MTSTSSAVVVADVAVDESEADFAFDGARQVSSAWLLPTTDSRSRTGPAHDTGTIEADADADAEREGLGEPDAELVDEAVADEVGVAVVLGEPVAEAEVGSGVGDVDGLEPAEAEVEPSGLGLPVLASSARFKLLADDDEVGEGSVDAVAEAPDDGDPDGESDEDDVGKESAADEPEGVGEGRTVRMTPGVQGSGSSTLAGPVGVLADAPAVVAGPCPGSPSSAAAVAQRLSSGATVGSEIATAVASTTIAMGHLRGRRVLRCPACRPGRWVPISAGHPGHGPGTPGTPAQP